MSYIDNIYNITSQWNERIDWDSYFMSLAFLISSRSSCDRLHVGCVLVRDTRVISVGYNGFLPKHPHKSHVIDNHEMATVHAEQNAITDCSKRGISSVDSIAYITHYPCINCAKILVSAGIKEIKYHFDYKNDKLVSEILNIDITKI